MHVVESIRIALRATSRTAAGRVGDRVSESVHGDLPDALSSLLDEVAPAGETLRIDRLELDLGLLPTRIDPHDVTARIVAQLKNALERRLSGSVAPPESVAIWSEPQEDGAGPRRDHRDAEPEPLEAFLHYLEHGTLPWWLSLERWREDIPGSLVERTLIEQLEARLIEVARRSPPALTRLFAFPKLVAAIESRRSGGLCGIVRTLPPSARSDRLAFAIALLELNEMLHGTEGRAGVRALLLVLRQFIRGDAASVRASRALLAALDPAASEPADHVEILRALLRDLADAPGAVEREVAADEQADPDAGSSSVDVAPETADAPGARPDRDPAPDPDQPSDREPPSHLLATESAGVVLLYPWLPNLFRNLGWLGARDRFHPGRDWFGAQALFVLSQGRPARNDAELILEKTLCGIPLAHAADLPALDDAVRDELRSLLTAVIRNWPALKNTSPDGLRESFLQRRGLLDLAAQPPELRIETRAYDLLLARLPWSVDPVLLPWLDRPLKVTWPTPH